MSSDALTVPLTISNFGYYAFHCRSSELSKTDRKIATFATILLSLTLGIGHLICRLFFYDRKIEQLKKLQLQASRSTAVAVDHYLLGSQYYEEGHFKEAANSFAQGACQGHYDSLTGLKRLVKAHQLPIDVQQIEKECREKQIKEVESLKKQAARSDATAADFGTLGFALKNLGNYQEAAEAFAQGVKLGKKEYVHIIKALADEKKADFGTLGFAFRDVEQYQEAAEAFAQEIRLGKKEYVYIIQTLADEKKIDPEFLKKLKLEFAF